MDIYKLSVSELTDYSLLKSMRELNPNIRFDLSGLDLRGFKLSGICLSNALLIGTNLIGAVLDEADLTGSDLTSAQLSSASLRGAILRKAILVRTQMERAKLVHADLSEANMTGINLSDADLSESYLFGVSIIDGNLRNASFKKAHVIRARFTEVDVALATFADATLEHVSFVNTCCLETDFTRVNSFSVSHEFLRINEDNTDVYCSRRREKQARQKGLLPIIEVNLIEYEPEYYRGQIVGWTQVNNSKVAHEGIPYPGTVIPSRGRRWRVRNLVFSDKSSECTVSARLVTLSELHEEITVEKGHPQSGQTVQLSKVKYDFAA